MLTRADVERIVENVLAQLTLEIRPGGGTNCKDIVLLLGDREITRATIDVTSEATFG